nr:uncharacterized protein LOC109180572 [Ipomoea batatas]
MGESARRNVRTSVKVSNPTGGEINIVFGDEPVVKTTKKIHGQKFSELTGNDIFKGDVQASLLWQQSLMDIGQNTPIGNSHITQKLAKLFIIPHSQLNLPWYYAILLVVPCCIPSQFQHLSSEILKNSSEINRSSGTNTLGVLSSLEESSDPADRELEPHLRGSRHRLCGFRLASTSAALPCTPAATHFQLRNPN